MQLLYPLSCLRDPVGSGGKTPTQHTEELNDRRTVLPVLQAPTGPWVTSRTGAAAHTSILNMRTETHRPTAGNNSRLYFIRRARKQEVKL